MAKQRSKGKNKPQPTISSKQRCYGLTANFHRCGRIGAWRFFCRDHVFQPWLLLASALFGLAFTVIPGLSFWASELRGPGTPEKVATRLAELKSASDVLGMQKLLHDIKGKPEYEEEFFFYSLYLGASYPGYDGATPPDFYFDRIDPGSLKYGQAIRHLSFYYISSSDTWAAAMPKFEKLSRTIERSGRIVPQKYFVEMMALGPHASYDDLNLVYNKFLGVYGQYYNQDEHSFAFIASGPFPTGIMVEVVPVPSFLYLLNREMSIAAARECRWEEKRKAIRRAEGIASTHATNDDGANYIELDVDVFWGAADLLRAQTRKLLAADYEAYADCAKGMTARKDGK